MSSPAIECESHEVMACAIWQQNDAAYLYAWAARYRDQDNAWMARKVQVNAAHSARLARESVDEYHGLEKI